MAGAAELEGMVAGAAVRAAVSGKRAGRAVRFVAVAPSAVERIIPQWTDLARRAVDGNVFFHPDFAVPAIGAFGDGVAVATVATATDRLLAAAPFTRTRLGRIAPAVRLWSHDYGPLGLPVVDANAVEEGVAGLVEGLAPDRDGTTLVVPDLPLDGPVAQALAMFAEVGGRPVAILNRRHRAMLERPAEGTVDVLSGLTQKRRKEYARQMRRLGDAGEVAVEMVVAPDAVRARFEEFLALEAAGWKGRGGTALASSLTAAEFARAAVSNRAEAGAARIGSIRVGRHPVAVIVCFVAGNTAFTWKIAHDEGYARYSPGAQLMMAVARSLFADPAIARIDSCADANHPMVDHLWPGRLAIGTMVVGPSGGSVIHRIGLAAANAEIAAVQGLKDLRGRRH